jgi:hypothetical protein
MAVLEWDQVGERVYETGVDHGVLYLQDETGAYADGFAWNGLVTVTESPSGAESNPQYADNIKYVNLVSAEEFGATIEAFTYPDEFAQCDGTSLKNGVAIGQQTRKPFGLAYRSLIGNDLEGTDFGYKLHLIYGAIAAPSEKAYSTVNDSPEAITFSWEVTTTPAPVGTVDSVDYKPAASLTIDSTKVDAGLLADLEDILFGTVGADPILPPPATVIGLFVGSNTEVTATTPGFTAGTGALVIPTVTGVQYRRNGAVVTGTLDVPNGQTWVINANTIEGYVFSDTSDTDWSFTATG